MPSSRKGCWRLHGDVAARLSVPPLRPGDSQRVDAHHLTAGDALRLDSACAGQHLSPRRALGTRGGRLSSAGQGRTEAARLSGELDDGAWQQGARQEAYQIARHLTARSPHTLLAWAVLAALGDVDDRALARNPIQSMDPDGEFVQAWLRIPWERPSTPLRVTIGEAALLAEVDAQ
jgi:hypothetical protein